MTPSSTEPALGQSTQEEDEEEEEEASLDCRRGVRAPSAGAFVRAIKRVRPSRRQSRQQDRCAVEAAEGARCPSVRFPAAAAMTLARPVSVIVFVDWTSSFFVVECDSRRSCDRLIKR